MITKQFKAAMKQMLVFNSNRNYGLPCKDEDGNNIYIVRLVGWPVGSGLNYGSNIRIGSGTTPATEDDYNLENRITSGVTVNVTAIQGANGLDSDGNPQLIFTVTITNTSESPVTVGEIGYFQDVNGGATQGSTSYLKIMLDRTLLNAPITIPSSDTAAITYVLKTIIN